MDQTFHPNLKAENGVCEEKTYGEGSWSERSFRAERGARLIPVFKGSNWRDLNSLRLPFELRFPASGPLSQLLHPYRQADIVLEGQRVGLLGEIHPQIRLDNKLKKARPCYFEIEETAFVQPSKPIAYVAPPQHMPLVRTISFGLPNQLPAQDVADILSASGASVQIVDRFEYNDDGVTLRSITYAPSW